MTGPWDETESVLRRAQDAVARSETVGEPAAAEAPTGSAEAMRGLVRVEVEGTRVADVHIDPKAMHRTAEDLAAAVRDATNAAFDDLRATMTADVPTPPSTEQLTRTLNELSTDSLRALRSATDGIQRSMDAIRRISEQHRGNG